MNKKCSREIKKYLDKIDGNVSYASLTLKMSYEALRKL